MFHRVMQRRLRSIGVVLLLLGSGLTAGQTPAPPAGQAPPDPTFKTEVEYVEVDALVTDQQGRFVRGLRREDFQIFEDGRPQTISNFALIEVPLPRPTQAEEPAFETDVRTTDSPFNGRLYVLILDSLHTAASRSPRVRAVARRFVDRYLGDNDLMAIVHTDGRTNVSQDFTANRRLLRAAVDGFMGQQLESATLARNSEFFKGTNSGTIADPFDSERGFQARSSLRSISQVADWLAGVRGRRKTILFLSEGIDYDITDVFNNRSASSVIDETRDAIAAATRGNVSIYAIDPSSITSAGADAIEVSNFADQAVSTAPTNDDGTVQQSPGINSRTLENERRLAQDSLRTLAEETGGYAAVGGHDVVSAFDRVVGDNSAYYALAYYPSPARRDGKFHRIEVKTTARDVRVRARRGYVAPRDNRRTSRTPATSGVSPALNEALNSPLPATAVGLRVFAAPFKATAPDASVVLAMEFRGRDLPASTGRMEWSYVAVDASAKIRSAKADSFSLTLPPETRKRVEEQGLRLLNRVSLPPGRYQLKVAARNADTGAVGSLNYELEIPNFYELPLSMSGLLLSSAAGAATITARPDKELQAVMPTPPVALRRFPQNDELLVFCEIYDRSTSTHTVDITTVVKSSDGAVQLQQTTERSSAELQGSVPGFRHLARLSMSKLQPGRYILSVEARSRLGQTTSRQVPFDVIP